MKKYSALPILFFLFVINAFSQANFTLKDLAGTYVYSSTYLGARFTLASDGKYEYTRSIDCCDPDWKEQGIYTIHDSKIRLKIVKHNLKDFKRKNITLDKTEYDMQVIKWGERIYLIKPSRLPKFAAAINLGVELRNRIFDDNNLTSFFYSRIGDENKPIKGKPELPNEWLSIILDSPIQATVVKFDGKPVERTYTINKGSSDGLKVGMCFVGENVKLEYDNLLWVTSVEEHSAKLDNQSSVFAPDYKVGDILTTKSYKGN